MNYREYNSQVDYLKDHIWKMISLIRGQIDYSEYSSVILLLLSLEKDGLIDNRILDSTSERLKIELDRAVEKNLQGDFRIYKEVYEAIKPSLHSINDISLYDLIAGVKEIHSETLNSHFGEIFDDVLYKLSKSQGRVSGESLLPLEISRLVCGLTSSNKRMSVYNPFAGLASFPVLLPRNSQYLCQELNKKTWAVGTLRLLAHNLHPEESFFHADSIKQWPSENQEFDLIISNPPFGLKLKEEFRSYYPATRTAEQFFIQKGIESLSNNGKLICVLPNGFLFKDGFEQRLRRELINSDLLDTVISLPGGLLMNSGIPVTIIIINKKKELPGVVKLVDAKDFVESKNARERVLKDKELLNFLLNNRDSFLNSDLVAPTSSNQVLVSNDRIRDNDFNLTVSHYLLKEFEGTPLEYLVALERGDRSDIPEHGKFIRTRDLKEGSIDYHLRVDDIDEVEDLNRYRPRRIDFDCLLVSTRWKTLKPTYFKFTGQSIYINNDIAALRVDSNQVEIGYLINELNSEYVKEQLEVRRIGNYIPFIRKDDLLNIKIKLPSLKEQAYKIEGLTELSNKIKALQMERNALVHGQSSQQFNEFASLKHTLGRPRQNILDWADNLLDFLDKNQEEVKVLNDRFQDFYEIDIISALKEIKRDINFITEILEKGEHGLIINQEKYPTTLISIPRINSLISELSNNGYNFHIKKYFTKGNSHKELGIECNDTLLKILIENILTNASKHGFVDNNSKNEVVIELTEVEDNLILEIKNNGKPFQNNFDKEKFVSKYSTANPNKGNGLGGYDINRIAKYFGNKEWELILNSDLIYPVKFKFKFPIIIIK